MPNSSWRQTTPRDNLGGNWLYFAYVGMSLAFNTLHFAWDRNGAGPRLTHIAVNGNPQWRYAGGGGGHWFGEHFERIHEEDVPVQVRNVLKQAWSDFVDGWGE